jgi:salicylate hydroxylase
MVLSHPDDSDPSTWNPATAITDMRREFKGWDTQYEYTCFVHITFCLHASRLEKLVGLIDKTLKWPLISGVPLTRWVTGKVLILGDAAHSMLPYMSQGKRPYSNLQCQHANPSNCWQLTGAAMAVEDGIALAQSLSELSDPADLSKALHIFEQVRKERAGKMQEASLLNGKLLHFADGPLQRARDTGMKPETLGLQFLHSPNQWSDPATQMWCYGYDAEREIDRAWEK